MRAVWNDANTADDYGKVRRYGIEGIYYAANDDTVTAARLQATADAGFKVGIYAAWNWQDWSPGAFATWVHQRLLQIGSPLNPWVCLDIETHDVAWITSALTTWRTLRPGRKTDWTLEPMQGGLFTPEWARGFQRLGIGLVPQHYGGSMQAFAADQVALDLVRHGFSTLGLMGFYDAARGLPIEWDGYAFTQQRLP